MNIFFNKGRMKKIVCVVACCGLVIAWANHDIEVKKMEERIKLMNVKTMCVGRFLLDVPENSIASYKGASLSGWEIGSWVETDENFFHRLTETQVELQAKKNDKGWVSLEQITEIRNDELHGRIFVFNRKWLAGYEEGEKTEEQVVSIRAFVRSREVTYEFDAKIRWEKDVAELEKIIGQLRWRGENEIPEQKGFCFNRGLILEPLTADLAEYTGIFLGWKDHPDLAASFTTMAGIDPGKTLLQRDAENDIKQSYRSRFHVLREGPRSLNGIPGEEVLERVAEPNGSTLHGFMWESLGEKDDVYLPSLILEFDTGHGKAGNPVNSSVSDREALALWDKISSSLRIRPVVAPKPIQSANRSDK